MVFSCGHPRHQDASINLDEPSKKGGGGGDGGGGGGGGGGDGGAR